MSPQDPEADKFGDLVARIADGEEPDWVQALHNADPVDRKVIESLKVIGDLARASRRVSPGPDAPSPESRRRDALSPDALDHDGPILQAGQRLGPYEIIDRIGSGGMGEVYRARQTQLGRDVAIKTLPWRSQISPDARRRFEREARLSASLVHRNVVGVHDFCEHEGIAFVVEELLDGRSWRSLIRENAGVTPPGARRMIADAASGVAAAHAVGLIHRDLKPENLFETRQGGTKVLDFGLARLLDPLPNSPDDGAPSSGVGLGTPAYTAPECMRGGPADRRSDVFALACSAYELLAGANPFLRANTGDTIVALLKETPAPLAPKLVGLPQGLADVIERGLSKQPEGRPTADEIAQAALAAIKEGPRPVVRQPGSARIGRQRVWVIAAVVALLGIALVSYEILRPLPVAVVRFDTSAIHQDLAYVGVAISERLNDRLSRAPGLTVRSGFLIGQRPVSDPRAAGRDLGARRVITGDLAETKTALAANVRIIDVRSGRREWEQRFEGSTADLPGLEDRILNGVTTALGVSIPESKPAPPRSAALKPEAQRLYAEGRYYWSRKMPNELYKAIDLFNQALALEPEYALAHAGLSRAYVDLSYNIPGVSSKETRVVARRAAERAVALDPNLVRGMTALGDVEAAAWNRDLAEHLYKKAMELDPTDPDAYLGEANDVLLPRGRFHEARDLLSRGLGLDVSSLARESLGRISYNERDYGRALREFSEVLAADPGFVAARYRLGQALLAEGRPEEALVPLGEADRQTGGLAKGRAVIVYALEAAGRPKEAEAMLAELLREQEKTYVAATLIALAYTGLGQPDPAFEWLQRGCDEHAEWMHLVAVEPLLDPLRKDRRFAGILKCARLEEP